MKKLPLSLIAASVSVFAAQAHAKTDMQIDQSLVDFSSIDDLTQAFYDSSANNFVGENLKELASIMTLDNQKIEISEEDLLAFNTNDATTRYGGSSYESVRSGCYNNCYNNCHGSRGWR